MSHHSIVVNKRYYDFDYDNNAIIMFDAEDVDHSDSNPLDWDVFSDDEEDAKCKEKEDKDSTPSADTLSSTSSPDLVAAAADSKQQQLSNSNCSSPKKRKNCRVTWISSDSGSARRIPFAMQVAHSYTIKKLEMQHYQLVDTATVKKQEAAARQQAKLAQLKSLQHFQYQYQAANPGGGPGGGAVPPYAAQYGHYPAPHSVTGHGGYRYPAHVPHAGPRPMRPPLQVPGQQAPRMRYMPQQQPRKQDGTDYVTYRAAPRTAVSPQK